ncbi:DUF1566 domain-containing protein [Leptospira barantonii]|uniref:Lcl C-terminal domain-containing protein n=1 Tax=Leptospira barantonii TaxID=2023184 RepID=A0ABX4NVY1_9LEPT|nr:DUF1566 domain-containing protein [Leptospira barantonii]PJZ59253.1 hypothetical protein CH367_04350 [Leptospira barantonii]
MLRIAFLYFLSFLIACKASFDPYNPEIPYSKAWLDTITLRCALHQNAGCLENIPPAISPFSPDKISDTGQTVCYDTSTNIACANAGYPRQDADFTSIPSNRSFIGPTAHPVYTNDYTTLDTVRGLIWKTCAEGLSGPTCGTGTASSIAFPSVDSTCAALNTQNSGAGYSGITTWRMPSIYELTRFANTENPTGTDTANFPGSPNVNFYSGTPYAPSPANTGWFIQVNAGFYDQLNSLSSTMAIRCVSGTALSTPSLTNNGDGTITDNRSGLVWQGGAGSGGLSNWQGALTYCDGLNLAGRTWRLPNVNELHSIVDHTVTNPSINSTYFPGTVSQYYWTSSTPKTNLTYASAVFFNSGLIGGNGKTNSLYVRCVAGP